MIKGRNPESPFTPHRPQTRPNRASASSPPKTVVAGALSNCRISVGRRPQRTIRHYADRNLRPETTAGSVASNMDATSLLFCVRYSARFDTPTREQTQGLRTVSPTSARSSEYPEIPPTWVFRHAVAKPEFRPAAPSPERCRGSPGSADHSYNAECDFPAHE